ncbi:MAG: response regulator [Bacteroidota bacterium]
MKKKVTIIDDDDDLRGLLSAALVQFGFEPDCYATADNIIKQNYRQTDLFLIDIDLSGISGLELCKHLKSQSATKDIPVIIISANPEIRALAEAVCAEGSLPKPFSQFQLKESISKALNGKPG